jgi:predicted TIM-barrel fold metal-dependent hydrolase
MEIDRRGFGRLLFGSAAGLALGGCGDDPGERYTQEDRARLAAQRAEERARSGTSRFGPLRFRGYRGLAELPWFELDDRGRLRLVAGDVPRAIDVHAHLGISVFLARPLDLRARTPRVRHLLDCDGEEPGCELDLDVYMNANFSEAALRALRFDAVRQGLWGGGPAATHTIPNLLDEMDDCGVERAWILPIAFGLPFRDDLTERWLEATEPDRARFVAGASVHPRDPERLAKLRAYAARGARAVKLHPVAQRFYPDAPEAMEIYAECGKLGLVVVFHCGRAGIEPEAAHRYPLPRHFEAVLAGNPGTRFVLGHAGARDVADALPLARHRNAWFDCHGQGVSALAALIEAAGEDRVLFGSDWPFYHLGSSLAKVLIVTEGNPALRHAILRGNAERLLAGTAA